MNKESDPQPIREVLPATITKTPAPATQDARTPREKILDAAIDESSSD